MVSPFAFTRLLSPSANKPLTLTLSHTAYLLRGSAHRKVITSCWDPTYRLCPQQTRSLPLPENLFSHSLMVLQSIQYQHLGLRRGYPPLTFSLDVRFPLLTFWLFFKVLVTGDCVSFGLRALGPCSVWRQTEQLVPSQV